MKNCREADQMNYILETCADSVQSAIEAKKGGANRIELCSNLVIGGTSPGESLIPSGEGADRFKCACTSSSKIWGFLL